MWHPDLMYETVRYEQQARIDAAVRSHQVRGAGSSRARRPARSLFAALRGWGAGSGATAPRTTSDSSLATA
jgi:hypothetical protein